MACGKERAVHGDVLGSGRRSGKEPVLAAECNRTDSILHQVVVDLQMTVMEVRHELVPQAHALLLGKCIPRALCSIARGSCVMDGNGCND